METNIKILTPAASYELLSLAEAKAALGIGLTTPVQDALINAYVENYSGMISMLTGRVFAREKVRERFWNFDTPRIYLSHYPVKEADIESVMSGGVLVTDYLLEEESGKLTRSPWRSLWREPVEVVYTGGYQLPDAGPTALKQAVILNMQDKFTSSGALRESGVRMISHKETRVMFYQAGSLSGAAAGKGGGATQNATNALIGRFMRHWV